MITSSYHGFNILFDGKKDDETKLYYYLRDKIMILFQDFDEVHLEIYKKKKKNIDEFTFANKKDKLSNVEIAITKISSLIKKHKSINLLCHVRSDFSEIAL